MKTDPTFLGIVRRVVGARIFIELSPQIPSASPIIGGRLHRLGQIGSFVRIPIGYLNLYGIVSMVGASELDVLESAPPLPPTGQRWIEVQLVGESYSGDPFQRGISIFPTIDDEVHVVTEEDTATIYPPQGPSHIIVGTHAASQSLPARVDLNKIVTRHLCIVGATGAGKSNAVANLLTAVNPATYPNARFLVIDPHGEYASAFQGYSRVYRIRDPQHPLLIPYWALSFDELSWFLVERKTTSESLQDVILREHIFQAKRARADSLSAGAVSPDEITVDSPIPFDIRELWYALDRAERVTYLDMPRSQEALVSEGDATTLISATFTPPGAGSAAPYKPAIQTPMSSYVSKILGRLKDRRFDFLLNPTQYDGHNKDLHHLLQDWIGHTHPITVFDLAGVPFEVIDLVVSTLTRILFEGMFWGRNLPGIGRQRPIVLVYEEAHSYLPRSDVQSVTGYARRAVQRVLKEGRKYGVGAILVTQRPAEIDETLLSQCGTFFALRLSNSDDRARIRSTLPEGLTALVDLLPALRTGEAVVSGEAIQIPTRVRFPLVEPRPQSTDPDVIAAWATNPEASTPYDQAVTAWRTQSTS